jgi:hypothetical protein
MYGNNDNDDDDDDDDFSLPVPPPMATGASSWNTPDAWDFYTTVYLTELIEISKQIDQWYRHCYHNNSTELDSDSDAAADRVQSDRIQRCFIALTNYYINASAYEQWTEVKLYDADVPETSGGGGGGGGDDGDGTPDTTTEMRPCKTTLRTHLFWELCRLRLVHRHHAVRQGHRLSALQFPEMLQRQLTLPKSTPVLQYSQRELEQAMYTVLVHWNMLAYSQELSAYVNLLLDRMAMFFCASFSAHAFDDVTLRQPLHLPPEVHRQLCRESEGGPFDETAPMFGPNFNYVYLCQLRYYIFAARLKAYEDRRVAPALIPAIGGSAAAAASSALSANILRQWCTTKARTIHGTLREELHRRYMQLLVPPGDVEWLRLCEPSRITAYTPTAILEKRRNAAYLRLLDDAGRSPHDILVQEHANRNLAGLYEWLVLVIIDKLMAEHSIPFLARYVVCTSDLPVRVDEIRCAPKPLLLQLFSRFLVYYRGLLHRQCDGEAREDAAGDIFARLGHWIHTLLHDFPRASVSAKLTKLLQATHAELAPPTRHHARPHAATVAVAAAAAAEGPTRPVISFH